MADYSRVLQGLVVGRVSIRLLCIRSICASFLLVHLSCCVELKQNILSSMVVWIAKLISIYIYTYMLFNEL